MTPEQERVEVEKAHDTFIEVMNLAERTGQEIDEVDQKTIVHGLRWTLNRLDELKAANEADSKIIQTKDDAA